MSLRDLDTARRNATSSPTAENLAHLEALLVRAGLSGQETFYPQMRALEASLEAAEAAEARMEQKRDRFASAYYRKHHQQDGRYTCTNSNCRGGYIYHWDTNYPCSNCHSDAPVRDRYVPCHKGQDAARGAAASLYAPFLSPLRAAISAAHQALTPYTTASLLSKGSRVRYINTRARAKFAADKRTGNTPRTGQRVPVGSEGEVFWIGQDFNGNSKFGVRTDEGETFFSARTNFDVDSLNAWEMLRGISAHQQAEARKAAAKVQAAQGDASRIVAVFGSEQPRRGQRCTLGAKTGKVAWTGTCKRTGRMRLGVKVRLTDRNEEMTWGFAAEAGAA